MLSEEEKERYRRQVLVPGWNQDKLKEATVLVVGLGGLGSASAIYLAAAGIGRIRLCDGDRVEVSDLNRQVLYSTSSLGWPKVEEAGRQLSSLNPLIAVEKFPEFLDSRNAERLTEGCRVIIDGLDNQESRFVLNEQVSRKGIPYVYGAVQEWQGYAGFFHSPRTACLACLMSPNVHSPSVNPVAGVLPGAIGLIQATEALKWIMGIEPALLGRLLIYDAMTLSFDISEVEKNPGCPVCSRR